MKSLDGVNKKNDVNNTASEAPEKNVKTESEKIDFSKVQIELLFEEMVDFDTFSKSDFRAVKVKECVAVPKSKKLLQFTLDDGTGTDRTILSGIHKVTVFYDEKGKKIFEFGLDYDNVERLKADVKNTQKSILKHHSKN